MARKPGPPSQYSEEIATRVCDAIVRGETLTNICAAADMPSTVTIWKWTTQYPAFANAYARARELQAHALWDEALTAARNATDKDSAAAARGVVDAVARLSRALNPRVYGDKLDVTTRKGVDDMTDDALKDAVDVLRGVVPQAEAVH